MDAYGQLVEKIIREQENIIGPVAVEQAQHVPGLRINLSSHEVKFDGDKKEILEKLINQYRDFFGHVAVEVCKEAAKDFITKVPKEEIPTALR